MDLADRIFKDIKKYKKVSLILAGGSSPLKYYRRLFSKKNNWSKLNLFLLDERLVKINSKLSNFHNINKIIQIYKLNVKFNRLNIKFKKNKNIKKTVWLIKKNYTISILGMGNDGHYASIFTNSKLFKKLVNTNISPRYLVTEKIGNPKVNRVTMNLSMILLSKKIYLILNTKHKLKIFKKAIKEKSYNKFSIYSLFKYSKNKLIIFDGKKFKKAN
tara:strand:+ start:49 stop:696 length:648 start_codon:yes stop_codon:yes gene_type:complete